MRQHYDRRQIAQWLGTYTLTKARGYEQAVRGVRWEGRVLTGQVQGTARKPYEVRIDFHTGGTPQWLDSTCSCPVAVGCKHVAALLLAAMAPAPDAADRSSPSPARAAPAAARAAAASDDIPVQRPRARAAARTPATAAPRAPSASQDGDLRQELAAWLERFSTACSVPATPTGRPAAQRQNHVLTYLIGTSPGGQASVLVSKADIDDDGGIRSVDRNWSNLRAALANPPDFVADDDLPILRALVRIEQQSMTGARSLAGTAGMRTLQLMVATGRAYATPMQHSLVSGRPQRLHAGPPRRGEIVWQESAEGRVRPMLTADPPASMLLPTPPWWYIDSMTGEIGVLDIPLRPEQLAALLTMPAMLEEEVPLVRDRLRELAPAIPPPPVQDASGLPLIATLPVPTLLLDTLPLIGGIDDHGRALDFATVCFDYEGIYLDPRSAASIVRGLDGRRVRIQRRSAFERRHVEALRGLGLARHPDGRLFGPQLFPEGVLLLEPPRDWHDFVQRDLPGLRAAGWQVVMSERFRFNAIEIEAVEGSVREAGDGWFDIEMGVTVNDRRVRLEPLLADLFQRDARWLSGAIDRIADDEVIKLTTDRGEPLILRAGRLKPLVRLLIDLFEGLGSGDGKLRLSAWDAGRLDAMAGTGRWEYHGDGAVRALAQRLSDGSGMAEVPLPRGLHAQLRDYQRRGLDWMQFLRQHGLSGVLADDMGLGKTIQTLAHLLTEKESGRLDRPALVVVPTTLIHNWCSEAARFAPDLRVLVLHGPQRQSLFPTIAEHDLVLTTYPLAWRDHAALEIHEYHLLILDEAQYVKNPAGKAAQAIRELRARHRLCLTGTPLENHLGELWAQFDFLLPGFLGSHKDFTRRWRTPIEKGGDAPRAELLARRIRPFMLRRRKDEVAKELPPKTVITRTVELEGGQRDLYETVRAAMQEKVRAAISERGFARSQIIVLEALTKLRQACCDPRLVKLTRAPRVKESAKLELLLAMLPDLIEEGRRILLFSQFTSMLALIGQALDAAGIPFVLLTGDTLDRVRPVKRFMDGEVPLFLISLKAGGVGLNLTAADTVIHYDPWWNPAVESQATDRAHRIGQDKPVFVYKLIAAGSVEEKIVIMQERKAALAAAILSNDPAAAVKFSADDLAVLFEPLPEPVRREAGIRRGRLKAG